MAVKYKIPFNALSITDPVLVSGHAFEVWLDFSDYVGSITTLKGGANPFILKFQSGDDNIIEPIRGSEATITYVNEGSTPLSEFTDILEQEIRATLYNVTLSKVMWEGFVVQDYSTEAFMPPPTEVTLIATDHLAQLQKVEFTNLSSQKVYDKLALSVIIEICLRKTGLNLPVNIFCNVFENGMDDRSDSPEYEPFSQAKVSTKSFLKDPDTFEDCYTILHKIMESWGCSVFQHLGEWIIIRWPEAKDFTNLIEGTNYEYDFTSPTAVTLSAPKVIGRTQTIKNAGGQQGLKRPLRYVKLTYNYEQPHKLILNDDLKRLGAFRSTATIGTIQYDKYDISDFINTGGNDAFITVETDTITGLEIQRYIYHSYQPSQVVKTKGIQIPDIEVNAGDRFDFSFEYRWVADTINDSAMSVRVELITSGIDYYLDEDGSWKDSSIINEALDVVIQGSEELDDWRTFDTTNHTGVEYPIRFPADGVLRITLYPANETDAEQDAVVRDFSFKYYTYINFTTKIKGQFHKADAALVVKTNLEETQYIDDSPKNNIKGVMFLDDGTTKTSAWHRHSLSESFRFGSIQATDKVQIHSKFRFQLEGTFKGLRQNDEYIGLITIFELTDVADKYFITGPVSYNWKNNVWSGTLKELWADTDVIAAPSATFEYIYNTN